MKTSSSVLNAILVACLGSFIANSACATSITINDASFETPALSAGGFSTAQTLTNTSATPWTWSDPSSASGIYSTTTTQYGSVNPVSGGQPQPDGANKQVAYFTEATFASITQTLTTTITANTTYTLTFLVGMRNDKPTNTSLSSFSGSLLDGTVALTPSSTTFLTPVGNEFLTQTLVFTTGSSVDGLALGIKLGASLNSGGEYDFDKVTLDGVTTTTGGGGATSTPLPSAAYMGLSSFGILGLVGLLRKKLRTA